MKRTILACMLSVLAVPPLQSQVRAGMCEPPEPADYEDCAELWNWCRPVAFRVFLSTKQKFELAKEDIETTVRSRLRAARIFLDEPELQAHPTMDAAGFLYVRVQVDDNLMMWAAEFQKVRTDIATDLIGFSPTGWSESSFGGHRNDGNFILSIIAPAIDKFVDDYLRVNEAACGERG